MASKNTLRALLVRALTNEGKDGCCLPIIDKCCCWRCDARRALGDNPTKPMRHDLYARSPHGFGRLPDGRPVSALLLRAGK